MRPNIQQPRRFDLVDIVRQIPRSLHDVGGVVRDLIEAKAGWRLAILVLVVIGAPLALLDVVIRETIAPDPDDGFRQDVGEAAFWAIMIAALALLFVLIFLLQWAALRLSGERLPSRTLAIAFAASQLPQAPITVAVLAVFALATWAGIDMRFGSPYSIAETVVVLLAFLVYLALAIAAAGISTTKSAATVLLGPGLVLALLYGAALLPL